MPSVSSSLANAPQADPPSGDVTRAIAAAAVVATIAFCVYASTLLPGVDLGDSAALLDRMEGRS